MPALIAALIPLKRGYYYHAEEYPVGLLVVTVYRRRFLVLRERILQLRYDRAWMSDTQVLESIRNAVDREGLSA